jgi:3-hydroxyacyl-[acyl-carrier-protein] dehydratase
MRFVLVDRIVSREPRRHIETLKNVSAAEDVFTDHFPGYPVYPGALIVEAFAQAAQLLIALSHEFTAVGRLRGLSRVAFRRVVRPGDQLTIRCERRRSGDAWVLDAAATVAGRPVAAATLEFTLEPAGAGTESALLAERLRLLVQALERAPVEAGRAFDE